MCIFHKWSKWEKYEIKRRDNGDLVQIELRQTRACIECGKHQDKLICII